jgi:excisionase family DNA binding protein
MNADIPLTIRQAAAALNVSVHTVRAWVWQRKLGFVRLGTRTIRIPANEVQRLLDGGYVPAAVSEKAAKEEAVD